MVDCNINLAIDYREAEIKNYFLGNDNVQVLNLDIGDIQIRNGETILFVIERKTICDLSSSIKDGRHREQKMRLINSGVDINNIMYLIEGDLDTIKLKCLPKSTIISSIINTLLRDNIKVHRSKNMNESIEFIEMLFNKLRKQDIKLFENKNTSYVSTIKLKKKENLDSSNCYLLQLAQIPGSSTKIADCIKETYPNMMSLCSKYSSIDLSERPKLLENLTYSIQNNKTRRIGKVVSERIYLYLSGDKIEK